MPRYTFHWECNERPAQHCWCLDLPDLAAAQRWAETETCNLSSVRRLSDLMADVVTIADEDDVPLVCVHAREVLTALAEGSRCSSFAA